ncbi:MAG: tetratricopeptide repeat protein [Archangium sp.]
MLAAASLVALLLTGTPGGKTPKVEGTKLEQGTKLFNQGDFDGALKVLDAAAAEGGDATTLEKVHLLRAQCFAARQDFTRAEDAFGSALDANPDTSLDPARVDPTLVKLLETVRARSLASVTFDSIPQGAKLLIDGKESGVTPQTISLPVGRHKFQAQFGDEATGEVRVIPVQLKPRKDLRVEWVQHAGEGGGGLKLEPRPIRPFGELRGLFEPRTSGAITGGLQVGGGIEFLWFRVGLWVRPVPNFDLTPRFQLSLPIAKTSLGTFNATVEVGVPLSFYSSGFAVGLQGAGGAELYLLDWLAPYLFIGGSHHFLRYGYDTAFIVTGGLRLRVP